MLMTVTTPSLYGVTHVCSLYTRIYLEIINKNAFLFFFFTIMKNMLKMHFTPVV